MLKLQRSLSDAFRRPDPEAARHRVERLRAARPELERDAPLERLVWTKCQQTGAIGAISAALSALSRDWVDTSLAH